MLDPHTTETTGNEPFPIGHEQIIFVLFKDTNCLIRNLKHRCSPRSVLRTASGNRSSLERKNSEANATRRDATRRRPAFHVTTSHEDDKKIRNNRDVFISDSIILANIFCTTRGLNLCGPTIELLCRLKFRPAGRLCRACLKHEMAKWRNGEMAK